MYTSYYVLWIQNRDKLNYALSFTFLHLLFFIIHGLKFVLVTPILVAALRILMGVCRPRISAVLRRSRPLINEVRLIHLSIGRTTLCLVLRNSFQNVWAPSLSQLNIYSLEPSLSFLGPCLRELPHFEDARAESEPIIQV